jgi:hypothetical protein
LARDRDYEDARKGDPPAAPKNIKLVCGDFRSLRLKGVGLIFTDPMWSDRDIWVPLGRWASDSLRPGGVLAAYTGQMGLPAALAGLGQHLRYYWTVCLIYSEKVVVAGRKIKQGWSPLVLFSKGPWRRPNHFFDSFHCCGKDKQYHPCQQNLDAALYYVRALSDPGDLIADPFGGSFTSAVACRLVGQGRRYVGCDVDEGCITVGRKRLAEIKP